MFRISSKGEYGVRAMFELATQYGEGPVPLKLIARRQGISEPYLEQLMAALRKAGLVNSVRGAQGGYELAHPPREIRVGDVIRVLEGPIAPMECVVDGATPEACGAIPACVTRVLWSRVKNAIEEVLDSTTLADLLDESFRQSERSLIYHI